METNHHTEDSPTYDCRCTTCGVPLSAEEGIDVLDTDWHSTEAAVVCDSDCITEDMQVIPDDDDEFIPAYAYTDVVYQPEPVSSDEEVTVLQVRTDDYLMYADADGDEGVDA